MININTQRINSQLYTVAETYNSLRLPVDKAATLIPDSYTSREFFTLELEKVFANGWIAVGCLQQVSKPGDILVVEVAGRSILIVCDKKGNLGAFYNVCRHRGSKLLEESCKRKSITCPYHSWNYGLDGKCLGTSMFNNNNVNNLNSSGKVNLEGDSSKLDKNKYGLLQLEVKTWGFLIFVNLNHEPSKFDEWLGDLPEKFKSHGLDKWEISSEKNYDVNSNYKLIAENFMEYYHLPFVHPELADISRIEDHYRFQGSGMYTGSLTTPVSRDVDSVWLNLPPVEGLEKKHNETAYHIWIFPNVAITLLPNHAFCLITDPIKVNQTIERTFLLTPEGTLNNKKNTKMFSELVTFWDLVNTQDLKIVERVQDGLRNTAFSGGRMCFEFEEPLHRFQNWIADKMCGIYRIPPGDDKQNV